METYRGSSRVRNPDMSPCRGGGGAGLAAYVGHFYFGEASGGGGALGGVAVGSGSPDAGDPLDELVVGGAVAHRASQVVAETGEQAGVQLALGGQPRPGAGAAGRLADRGDQAHLTRT